MDLVFGGEDLDHLLLLSKKHLYKMTGVVVQSRWGTKEHQRNVELRNNRSAAVFGTFSQSDRSAHLPKFLTHQT